MDPNPAGYLVTPIQIAVANRTGEGVRNLLETGADPNATGDRNGVPFKTNTFLEWANELHGLSPLQICRHFERPVNEGCNGAEMAGIRNENDPSSRVSYPGMAPGISLL